MNVPINIYKSGKREKEKIKSYILQNKNSILSF
jgi:hypothetical protein